MSRVFSHHLQALHSNPNPSKRLHEPKGKMKSVFERMEEQAKAATIYTMESWNTGEKNPS